MRTQKSAIALAALAMSFNASASTVDLFTTNQGNYVDATSSIGDQGLTINNGAGGSASSASGDILGGNRDMFVSLLSGPVGSAATMGVSAGAMTFGVSLGATGRGQIQWDGAANMDATVDFTGLGGVDLSQGGINTALAFDINTANLAFDFTFTAYTDATHWARVTINSGGPISTTTTFLTPFALFTSPVLCGAVNPYAGVTQIQCSDGSGNAGGTLVADMTNLGALVADIDRSGGTVSLDPTIDKFYTVPEPGVLSLVGIGLLGLAALAWRRPAAAATRAFPATG